MNERLDFSVLIDMADLRLMGREIDISSIKERAFSQLKQKIKGNEISHEVFVSGVIRERPGNHLMSTSK